MAKNAIEVAIIKVAQRFPSILTFEFTTTVMNPEPDLIF